MQIFWSKYKIHIIVVMLLLLVVVKLIGSYSIWRLYMQNTSTRIQPIVSTTTNTLSTVLPELHPLQIEAIKAREYPGSEITIEQDLGNRSGYNQKIVSYKSDEFKVFALLATPIGVAPNGGWPVVILNHGYVEPSKYQTDNSYYTAPISALAQNGVAVLMPDYRGHGSSQGTPEGGHFSPVYTYDDLNLINSIPQSPELGLSSTRVGTLGHSLGAHTSLRVAVVNPNIKATAYLSGVVGSIDDILFNWPNSPMPSDLPVAVQNTREQLLTQYGTPKTNPEFWNSVSAINYVGNVTGASQIHHSQNDTIVPLNFSTKLDTALKTAGKPVEFYVYPGSEHQIISNSQLAITRMVEFFRKSL